VLEKDNDLDISALARANALDVLRLQREGPYLLGGHSYGGRGRGGGDFPEG
jgi:thioesterase domain-containing protein